MLHRLRCDVRKRDTSFLSLTPLSPFLISYTNNRENNCTRSILRRSQLCICDAYRMHPRRMNLTRATDNGSIDARLAAVSPRPCHRQFIHRLGYFTSGHSFPRQAQSIPDEELRLSLYASQLSSVLVFPCYLSSFRSLFCNKTGVCIIFRFLRRCFQERNQASYQQSVPE